MPLSKNGATFPLKSFYFLCLMMPIPSKFGINCVLSIIWLPELTFLSSNFLMILFDALLLVLVTSSYFFSCLSNPRLGSTIGLCFLTSAIAYLNPQLLIFMMYEITRVELYITKALLLIYRQHSGRVYFLYRYYFRLDCRRYRRS